MKRVKRRQSRLITNQLKEFFADVAQLAEQLICNQQVNGSSPFIGFIDPKGLRTFSSVGESNRLITGRSRVRVPEGPFSFFYHYEKA